MVKGIDLIDGASDLTTLCCVHLTEEHLMYTLTASEL